MEAIRGDHAAGAREIEILSRREREVVVLDAMGLSNKAIAAELCISRRTVEAHLRKARAKLEADSREDLMQAVLESGMLFEAPPERLRSLAFGLCERLPLHDLEGLVERANWLLRSAGVNPQASR